MELYKPNFKITFITILSVVIVLLNSGYYRSTANDSLFPFVLLVLLSLVSIFVNKKIKFEKNLYIVWFIVFSMLSALINFSYANILSAGRICFTLFFSLILFANIDKELFIRYFSMFVRALIIISLLFSIIQANFSLNLPIIHHHSSGASSYYDLFIITQKVGVNRATGIFWEPGCFASIIIESFILEKMVLTNRKKEILHTVIYFVGIIITYSTAGILIMLLLVLAFFLKGQNSTKVFFSWIVLISVIVLFFVFQNNIYTFLGKVNPRIFGKLLEENSNTTFTRINCPLINLEFFVKKPLFGYGYTNYSLLYDNKIREISHLVTQTSTSTQVLASIGFGGIVYTLMFLIPLLKSKKSIGNLVERILIAISIMLIVNKEPHLYIVSTWFLGMFLNVPDSNKI